MSTGSYIEDVVLWFIYTLHIFKLQGVHICTSKTGQNPKSEECLLIVPNVLTVKPVVEMYPLAGPKLWWYKGVHPSLSEIICQRLPNLGQRSIHVSKFVGVILVPSRGHICDDTKGYIPTYLRLFVRESRIRVGCLYTFLNLSAWYFRSRKWDIRSTNFFWIG